MHTTIGLDLAKNVFQVHGVGAVGKVVYQRQLRRGQVIAFFKKLPHCLVGMEACATGHHRPEQGHSRGRRDARNPDCSAHGGGTADKSEM